MPESSPESGDSTRPARLRWVIGVVLGVLALVWFGLGLASEPHFMDESAYYSQTYFADLLFRRDLQNAEWLEYAAFDLPPLPKYMIGAALAIGGYPRPGPAQAARWYGNAKSRFEPAGALEIARIPSVLLGAAGCVAVYTLGLQMRDVTTGVAASLLLMLNPLYRSHARRAMSDVPAEAFLLLALALGLWCWTRELEGRRTIDTTVGAACAGVFAGLAALCKLNGALAMIVLVAWAVLAIALTGIPAARRAGVVLTVILAGELSLLTFLLLNPFLIARPARPQSIHAALTARLAPWQRVGLLITHRISVSEGQQELHAHDALTTVRDKVQATLVQGFGRFGPFGPAHDDSTRRYELRQDWGMLLWLPWVVAGGCWAVLEGARQRRADRPPTAWAILVQAIVAFVVVTAYLPLAWNRYFLSLQAGSALLAAGAGAALAEHLTARGRLASPRA